MAEKLSKSGSSLAITEKRPQKSGSCTGIFYQLLDWNRRFAKKKLFSKKLFPPVGAKRISNKFRCDDRFPMAKLLLIADENRGGFPSMKRTVSESACSLASSEQNKGMQTPGLVARLMGLESMPMICHDKPKNAPVSDFCYSQGKKPVKCVNNTEKSFGYCYDRDMNSEKGPTKFDTRPKKLQKIGYTENLDVMKFGAEALEFRSVLLRSRRQHHMLTSPVKHPRILSGRKSVRLMQAATKILEPGLQATNRAKCSLTYSSRISLDQIPAEGPAYLLKQTEQPSNSLAATPSIVKPTCSSCGNFLRSLDFMPNIADEQVSSSTEFTSSEISTSSSLGSGKSMDSLRKSLELDEDVDIRSFVFQKYHEGLGSLAAQAKVNVWRRTQNSRERRPHVQREKNGYSFGHECKPPGAIGSTVPKMNNEKDNELHGRPKSLSHQSRSGSPCDAFQRKKDSVVSINNLSSRTTPVRSPVKGIDNCKEKTLDRKPREKKDDTLLMEKNLVRKRRPVNCNPQVENVGFASSTPVKPRIDICHKKGSAGSAPGDPTMKHRAETEVSKRFEGNGARIGKDADTDSPTFHSLSRKATGSSSPAEHKKKQNESKVSITSKQDDVTLGLKQGSRGNSSHTRVTELKGDAVGALLEQKLKELSSLERDESAAGDNLTGRSTASILQELIAALTVAKPISQENGDNCLDEISPKDSFCNGSSESFDCSHVDELVCCPSSNFQVKSKTQFSVRLLPLGAECDHPSPTSILDTSFSPDSRLSECLNAVSGDMADNQYTRTDSYDLKPLQFHDPDLTDLSSSIYSRMFRMETLNNISSVFGIDAAEIGLTGIKLDHARDVIWNAELLFGNDAPHSATDAPTNSLADASLLDELEALVIQLWKRPKFRSIDLGVKEGDWLYQRRGFLFDCVVEWLDSRDNCYLKSGFKEWSKLSLPKSRYGLAREVYGSIIEWTDLAGRDLDDMVEIEMCNSVEKWTDFKHEAFDMGIEIVNDILHILIHDVIMDL